MKELINAIKAKLVAAASLTYIIDSTGIWITPNENILPISATFPGIGIKDGPITRIVHTNLKWEVHLSVGIIVYVEPDWSAAATSIIGQTDPLIHGILDIADNIHGVLNEEYLSITGMEQAFCVSESEAETIPYDDLVVLQKRLNYEYIKEETRP